MPKYQDRDTGSRTGFVALTVLAAALGAGAALLLAPEEGAQTRRRVGQRIRSLGGEAAETIAQLRRELRRRQRQSRRDRQIIGLVGFLAGAGLSALLVPESGSETRRRLSGTLGRIKVGTVDRIDRLRQPSESKVVSGNGESQPVRSVQELGRDPDAVF
jgi:gas vesicle protein